MKNTKQGIRGRTKLSSAMAEANNVMSAQIEKSEKDVLSAFQKYDDAKRKYRSAEINRKKVFIRFEKRVNANLAKR